MGSALGRRARVRHDRLVTSVSPGAVALQRDPDPREGHLRRSDGVHQVRRGRVRPRARGGHRHREARRRARGPGWARRRPPGPFGVADALGEQQAHSGEGWPGPSPGSRAGQRQGHPGTRSAAWRTTGPTRQASRLAPGASQRPDPQPGSTATWGRPAGLGDEGPRCARPGAPAHGRSPPPPNRASRVRPRAATSSPATNGRGGVGDLDGPAARRGASPTTRPTRGTPPPRRGRCRPC